MVTWKITRSRWLADLLMLLGNRELRQWIECSPCCSHFWSRLRSCHTFSWPWSLLYLAWKLVYYHHWECLHGQDLQCWMWWSPSACVTCHQTCSFVDDGAGPPLSLDDVIATLKMQVCAPGHSLKSRISNTLMLVRPLLKSALLSFMAMEASCSGCHYFVLWISGIVPFGEATFCMGG